MASNTVFYHCNLKSVNANAAEEDLENIKPRIGGQKIVKRCMRDTMFVGRTSHQFLARLPVDQREAPHHLPDFRDIGGWKFSI